jgi:diaminohydroxyphosphoribosylaminopyrimidine deaminase/5-amino-6-(5-phosphoribosylamino)uracil reductase
MHLRQLTASKDEVKGLHVYDLTYMQLALDLAKACSGQTSPNPTVGAVVVKDNVIVGQGAHLRAGGPHAEVFALNMAGEFAKDSTLYVTLEPCCHFGKTPPCVDMIIQCNVKRVVVATLDPNPLVAGSGITKLREAGLEVEVGVLQPEAQELNKVFFHYIQSKTPYITLKCGMSLDGKLATESNESKWITNETSRLDAHQLRHEHDAILVGVNTIIKDNPSLTTRLPHGGGKNPIRIILDTHLRTPKNSQVLMDNKAPTWLITGADTKLTQIHEYEQLNTNTTKASSKIRIIQVPIPSIEIAPLMKILAKESITSILIEGGSTVHSSFIKQKLVNQFVLYISPQLIGGEKAPSLFEGTGFFHLSDTFKLKFDKIENLSGDIKVTATPIKKE